MGFMHDKVVLVTGAAWGIGASCAELFAQNEARCVFLVDTEYDSVEERSLRIASKTGVECIPIKADLTKECEAKTVFDIVLDKAERLDILVNSTGLDKLSGTEDADIETWDFTLSRGLKSSFLSSREAVKIMRKQKSGTIISVMPQLDEHSGWTADSDDYSSTKAGLVYLTKTLAKRAAKYGITVKGVSARLFESCELIGGSDENVFIIGSDTGLREVADTVLFLASDHARYMTGTCVDVNCGRDAVNKA